MSFCPLFPDLPRLLDCHGFSKVAGLVYVLALADGDVVGEELEGYGGDHDSNLKNDYAPVRLWNYRRHTFARTGMQFCGLMMGDHSKAGINCMFNTATVVGVGVNIHGSGFPRTFIPSFSAGSPVTGFSDVPLDKFYDTAGRVMARRGLTLSDADKAMFEHIYRQSAQFK